MVSVQLQQVTAAVCGNYKSISPKATSGRSLGPVHGKNVNAILTLTEQRLSRIFFLPLWYEICQANVFSFAELTRKRTWVDSLGFGEVRKCQWEIWLILISILQGIGFHPCVPRWYSHPTHRSASVSPTASTNDRSVPGLQTLTCGSHPDPTVPAVIGKPSVRCCFPWQRGWRERAL